MEIENKILYRLQRDFDGWDFKQSLIMAEYEVIRETEMCYVISYRNKEKFILKNQGRKRFARLTKERAISCFIFRSKKRLGYLKGSVKSEQEYLRLSKLL